MKNIFKLTLLHILLYFQFGNLKAQSLIKDNNTRMLPHPDAVLHLQSASKGFLLPRLALQSLTLFSPLKAHVRGMVVYNTETVGTITPGMYYNDGGRWKRMTINTPLIGDIKYGLQAADHNGWYLLNGRGKSEVSSIIARRNADLLGFGNNIPNATDRFIKTAQNNESSGSTGGSFSFKIEQNNLPDITFAGVTGHGAIHTHTYIEDGYQSVNAAPGMRIGPASLVKTPVPPSGRANAFTSLGGDHSHSLSFSIPGRSEQISFTPQHMVTNVFIYLGN